MRKFLYLVAMVGIILGFRFWMIRNIEFTNTEHSLVYRSWNISMFGSDEYGRHIPFLFGTSDGAQLPILTYLATPFSYVLGSGTSTEFVLDFIFFIMPAFTALVLSYGMPFAILLSINPIFFWPGNWEAKVLTAVLLYLWRFITSEEINIIWILFLSLLSFAVSFDAWFVAPLVLVLGLLYRKEKFKQIHKGVLGIAIGCVVLLITLSLFNRNILNHLKFNYFTFSQDISVLNTINQFRGADIRLGFGLLGKVLHNKLQLIPVVIGHSLSYLNPSFLFATGDIDTLSNSMWVPPFLSIYFMVLMLSTKKILRKKNVLLFIWISTISLFLGLMGFPQSERHIYLIAIPLVLLVSQQVTEIPNPFLYIFPVLLMINLVGLGILSGTVKSAYVERCPLKLVSAIVDKASLNTNHKVYVTDDVCSDLAPGLLMLTSSKAPVEDDKSFFRKRLRKIENIEIVSPFDIHSIYEKEMASKNDSVYILSGILLKSSTFPVDTQKIINKDLIFEGSHEDLSMYAITSN